MVFAVSLKNNDDLNSIIEPDIDGSKYMCILDDSFKIIQIPHLVASEFILHAQKSGVDSIIVKNISINNLEFCRVNNIKVFETSAYNLRELKNTINSLRRIV